MKNIFVILTFVVSFIFGFILALFVCNSITTNTYNDAPNITKIANRTMILQDSVILHQDMIIRKQSKLINDLTRKSNDKTRTDSIIGTFTR